MAKNDQEPSHQGMSWLRIPMYGHTLHATRAIISRENNLKLWLLLSFYLFLWCLSCLLWILGRRLKGASQTRSGEEEQSQAQWRHGERGEGAGNKDGILERGNTAVEAQGELLKRHCPDYSVLSLHLLELGMGIMRILLILLRYFISALIGSFSFCTKKEKNNDEHKGKGKIFTFALFYHYSSYYY